MRNKSRTINENMLTIHEHRRRVVKEEDSLECQRLIHEHRAEISQHLLFTTGAGRLEHGASEEYEQRNGNDYN